MTRIEEGGLAFEFGECWDVFKLDDHRDYRKGIAKIQDSKAVDFLGIFNDSELYFIEVKDFRGYRIENRDRISSGQLAVEVARKVKDSLACIIGAFHGSSNSEYWRPYMNLLCVADSQIKIALWLEEDLPPAHPRLRQKAMASTRTKVFKQKLGWLTKRVLVCGGGRRNLPDSRVSSVSND